MDKNKTVQVHELLEWLQKTIPATEPLIESLEPSFEAITKSMENNALYAITLYISEYKKMDYICSIFLYCIAKEMIKPGQFSYEALGQRISESLTDSFEAFDRFCDKAEELKNELAELISENT